MDGDRELRAEPAERRADAGELPLRIYAMADAGGAALDALELVGLAGREELACRYLSQGQKRRVALARLVNERRALWILDEPYVALDTAAVALVASVIGAHLQRGGLAVLTTHQAVPVTAGAVRELVLEAPSGVRQG